jgi:hypothetical protein
VLALWCLAWNADSPPSHLSPSHTCKDTSTAHNRPASLGTHTSTKTAHNPDEGGGGGNNPTEGGGGGTQPNIKRGRGGHNPTEAVQKRGGGGRPPWCTGPPAHPPPRPPAGTRQSGRCTSRGPPPASPPCTRPRGRHRCTCAGSAGKGGGGVRGAVRQRAGKQGKSSTDVSLCRAVAAPKRSARCARPAAGPCGGSASCRTR